LALDTTYSRGTPIGPMAAMGLLPDLKQSERVGAFGVYAHPSMWSFEGGEWLPIIKVIAAKAGVHGAVSNGDRLDDTAFRATQAKFGYIDVTYHPGLTAKYGHLVNRHPMNDGGAHYTPPWQGVAIVAGKTRLRTDDAMYLEFRRDVVEAIGPMAVEVLEDRMAVLDARVASLRLDRSGGANVLRRIDDGAATLAAMRAAWSKQFDAPKKARKAKEVPSGGEG
jgi:hypothetical protein